MLETSPSRSFSASRRSRACRSRVASRLPRHGASRGPRPSIPGAEVSGRRERDLRHEPERTMKTGPEALEQRDVERRRASARRPDGHARTGPASRRPEARTPVRSTGSRSSHARWAALRRGGPTARAMSAPPAHDRGARFAVHQHSGAERPATAAPTSTLRYAFPSPPVSIRSALTAPLSAAARSKPSRSASPRRCRRQRVPTRLSRDARRAWGSAMWLRHRGGVVFAHLQVAYPRHRQEARPDRSLSPLPAERKSRTNCRWA